MTVNYYDLVFVLLFAVGFATLLLHKNLVKKIIGLNIADTAIFLFLTSKGYISGGEPPIVALGADPATMINPVPAGLILTGIVISVSVTAFALALVVSLYKKYSTLDLDEMIRIAAREKEEY